ncbi:uroporphyrinogen-III synthase [Microbacterium protaetiae]|uniref:Uroporphyrinogen-III synthase n=1 Tax=Microbacterium protaetiae TaxID=2509458 RepID=A0A4P6EFT1_9MICO|nr:uroporphyrinogen-III synthase [Microbacterium protaetiae]QAY61145.1 uroporphyrinogen-III synthase [Microbacterium protaetiae]
MTARANLSAALAGCTIVITADRRSTELTAALERHGARVQHAPALTIVPHADDTALALRTRELLDAPPDVVVVTTGVGFRGWMEAADEEGLGDDVHRALAGARFLARGPKARGAIQQAGFDTAWVAETETAAELGAYLVAEGLTGRRIAVQHHGAGADGLDELCTAHGAEVVSLTVYRWGPPPDPDAVRRSVHDAADGGADAVLFTSAPGAAEWLACAVREGLRAPIAARSASRRLLLAAVGPVTAAPLQAAGLTTTVADRGRLGALVRTVIGHFGTGGAHAVETPAGRLQLRSTGAVVDGSFLPLSRTCAAVLELLFDADGAVVSRRALQRALPRSAESTHAVDMAVARLREALGVQGLIRTVIKRGYRLEVREGALTS